MILQEITNSSQLAEKSTLNLEDNHIKILADILERRGNLEPPLHELLFSVEGDRVGRTNELYRGLPNLVGPEDANRCCEVVCFRYRLPDDLRAKFFGLEGEDEGAIKNVLANPENTELFAGLEPRLQRVAQSFLEHPDFEQPVAIEAMLHPHGPFHGDNKRAIVELALADIPELSQIAQVYIWQLLSNHQFSETEDKIEGIYYRQLDQLREELNRRWHNYLAVQEDIYADGVSRRFVDTPEIQVRLVQLASTFDSLGQHRIAFERQRDEAEGVAELESNIARGQELTKNLVDRMMYGDSLDRIIQANPQIKYSLNTEPNSSVQNLNQEFALGMLVQLETYLSDEELRRKVDLRLVAAGLLQLHGVKIDGQLPTTAIISNLDLTGLATKELSELSHGEIATILVTDFIVEIAERHDLDVGIPRNVEQAKKIREKGLSVFNAKIFSGTHGEGDLGGYHAIVNETTGEVDICADHAGAYDRELQSENKGANDRLRELPDVDYTDNDMGNRGDMVNGLRVFGPSIGNLQILGDPFGLTGANFEIGAAPSPDSYTGAQPNLSGGVDSSDQGLNFFRKDGKDIYINPINWGNIGQPKEKYTPSSGRPESSFHSRVDVTNLMKMSDKANNSASNPPNIPTKGDISAITGEPLGGMNQTKNFGGGGSGGHSFGSESSGNNSEKTSSVFTEQTKVQEPEIQIGSNLANALYDVATRDAERFIDPEYLASTEGGEFGVADKSAITANASTDTFMNLGRSGELSQGYSSTSRGGPQRRAFDNQSATLSSQPQRINDHVPITTSDGITEAELQKFVNESKAASVA